MRTLVVSQSHQNYGAVSNQLMDVGKKGCVCVGVRANKLWGGYFLNPKVLKCLWMHLPPLTQGKFKYDINCTSL